MPNERYEDMCDGALADEQKDNRESNVKERMKQLMEERTSKPERMIRNLSLTFAELREANVARCNDVFHKFEDWNEADWGVALAGEVGEMFGAFSKVAEHSGNVCNLIKKMRRGESIPLNEVGKEIADVMIYLDLLAASLEVDLAREVILKFNEVSEKRGSTIYL